MAKKKEKIKVNYNIEFTCGSDHQREFLKTFMDAYMKGLKGYYEDGHKKNKVEWEEITDAKSN